MILSKGFGGCGRSPDVELLPVEVVTTVLVVDSADEVGEVVVLLDAVPPLPLVVVITDD